MLDNVHLLRTFVVSPAKSLVLCALLVMSSASWSASAACDGTNDGATCDDGNACTQTDTCQAGVCVGANPLVCTALDQCHNAGTCNPATGSCSNPVKLDGSPCSDGNACTRTDSCQAGICVGANPVVCSALDQCHTVGSCNTSTGICSNPIKANGSPCSDGNACTRTDSCQTGICVGANPIACTALDACHKAGTCDSSSGVCSNPISETCPYCSIVLEGTSVVFSGLDGSGIFKSSNGGDTWSAATTQPTNLRIKALVKRDSNVLYAGTYGNGIYRSSDGGVTWGICVGQPSNTQVTALGIDTGGLLYAGTEGGLFKSVDACAQWTAINTGLQVDALRPPLSIVIDPTTSATLYVGFFGAGIFKSLNGGAIWTAALTQPTNLDIRALAFGDSSTLYAATHGDGVFKSTDAGLNWTACSGQPSNTLLLSLVVDALGTIYVGSEAGVFKSTNGCTSWTAMNTGLPN